MIKTERVEVHMPKAAGVDELFEPIVEYGPGVPVDVIVAPGSTSDMFDNMRDGHKIAYTLHFPKTWTVDLCGARVSVRGRLCRVVGSPQPYTSTPGKYNMPVEVVFCDG